MRELTPEEQQFIQDNMELKDKPSPDRQRAARRSRSRKRLYSIFRARNFAVFFLATGVFTAGLFMMQMFQIESMIGKDNLNSLLSQGLDPAVSKLAEQVGAGSLIQTLTIYANRWYITAGILTLAVLLTLMAYVIESLFFYRLHRSSTRRQHAASPAWGSKRDAEKAPVGLSEALPEEGGTMEGTARENALERTAGPDSTHDARERES